MKILVADRSQYEYTHDSIIALLLQSAGHEVTHFENQEDALQGLKNQEVDLLITDWNLGWGKGRYIPASNLLEEATARGVRTIVITGPQLKFSQEGIDMLKRHEGQVELFPWGLRPNLHAELRRAVER